MFLNLLPSSASFLPVVSHLLILTADLFLLFSDSHICMQFAPRCLQKVLWAQLGNAYQSHNFWHLILLSECCLLLLDFLPLCFFLITFLATSCKVQDLLLLQSSGISPDWAWRTIRSTSNWTCINRGQWQATYSMYYHSDPYLCALDKTPRGKGNGKVIWWFLCNYLKIWVYFIVSLVQFVIWYFGGS